VVATTTLTRVWFFAAGDGSCMSIAIDD